MDRREFLRIAGLAGLAMALPSTAPRRAVADDTPYTGPLFLSIHAAGGWDPIFLTDTKLDPVLNRRYTEIGEANGIPYAKIPYDPVFLQLDALYHEAYAEYLLTNETFFTRHGAKTLVLNGIDTTTNSHDTGARVTWSGRTSEGYPAIAALTAAARGAGRPMAFLSGGGYDATIDVVPLTRIARLDIFTRVAQPNRIDAANATSRTFHSPTTATRIDAAQKARMQSLIDNERLPRVKRAAGALLAARTTDVGLDRLVIPTQLVDVPGNQLDDLQGLMQQTQIAMSAFKSGLAVSAGLNLGGFDTHSNHDRSQLRQMMKILKAVDYAIEEATRQGVADRLTIMVGSDFGRGPHYNGTGDNGGKDHWPITTVLLMGPGIRGGRVIGATDGAVKPRLLDPTTLEVGAAGVRLRPEHIHRQLRRALHVEDAPASARFPLAGEDLPLLT